MRSCRGSMSAPDPIPKWQEMKERMRRGAFVREHPYPLLWVYMEQDPDTDLGVSTGIRSVDDPDEGYAAKVGFLVKVQDKGMADED